MHKALAAALLCLAPFLALTADARADSCAIASGDSVVWDHVGSVTDVNPMTVLLVTRFTTTQGKGPRNAKPELWTNDVPSDTLGAEAICDRVQLETPLAFDGPDQAPLILMQGERIPSDLDIAPDLAARLQADNRQIQVPGGPAFVFQVEDLNSTTWRGEMLEAAKAIGRIDQERWVIGMAGALYLVPMVASP